jgi:geranyl-CoA carboxylase alpha subunit
MTRLTPYHKILIANRGEIAMRVIRTAHSLGYRTVAVYSDADSQARHVLAAHQAVHIGNSPPRESYLNIPRIIAAAIKSGCDAVHPGYGFLAENSQFAAACASAGLVFIGPSAAAIEAMGNKAGAKRLMIAADVPCIPGYQGDDQDEKRLISEAASIGFPVMIKAAAGGGGRGIRLVRSAKEFPAALRTARSESQSAFGNPAVILERAVAAPRHIEIQIFADRYGQVIHLGERDCSVQRRHQKLIEESPSPAVNAELRERIGATAIAAARAIHYEGAGTIEYLLDASGEFYFMEMNTRLQVEHPVTEAITGFDLVEMQLRVAAGEPLAIRQEDIRFHGHAIEARLCCEDADQAFMPQSGTMTLWEVPANIRIEHALASGSAVPPYYDSMIAKLIGTGRNREDARRQLLLALEDIVALGVTTNQAFLASCLRHPTFVEGAATTAFIDSHSQDLLARDGIAHQRVGAIAALLLLIGESVSLRTVDSSRLSSCLPVSMRFEMEGEVLTAVVIDAGARYFVTIHDKRFEFVLRERRPPVLRMSCDGLLETVVAVLEDRSIVFRYAGRAYRATDLRFAPVLRRDVASDGVLRALMSGRIVALHAAVGDVVAAGAPVFTLEAMKMEHTHVAPRAGRLLSLNVELNEQVTAHRVVAEIAVETKGIAGNDARTPVGPV